MPLRRPTTIGRQAEAAEGADGWQQPTRRRRRGRTALVAVSALAAAVAIAATISFEDPEPPPLEVETGTDPVEATPPGSVTDLPPAPLTPRAEPVQAWTGEELVVWGGWTSDAERLALYEDGAALNPGTGQWREIAPAPMAPRAQPAYAWGGGRLFVWGGVDEEGRPRHDGAVYVPAEDRWEPLPPAPIEGRALAGGAWTGEEFLVLGGTLPHSAADPGEPAALPRNGAAFDPVQGTWRPLPAPPEGFSLSGFPDHAWTGERLLLWQGTQAAAYDPERDTWEGLDLPPRLRAQGLTSVVVLDSGHVAVLGVRPARAPRVPGIVYDLELAEVVDVLSPGGPTGPATPRLVAADRYLVALPLPGTAEGVTDAVVWDFSLRRWSPLPAATCTGCAVAWTGDELLLWGADGEDGDTATALRWRPPPPS